MPAAVPYTSYGVIRQDPPVLSAPAGLLWQQGSVLISCRAPVDYEYDTEYDGIWACGECGVIGHGTSGREILRGLWMDTNEEFTWPNSKRYDDVRYTHVTCDACIALRTTLLTDIGARHILGDLLRRCTNIVLTTAQYQHYIDKSDRRIHRLTGIVYAMVAVHEHRINKPRVPVSNTGASTFVEVQHTKDPHAATMRQNIEVAETYSTGNMAGVHWWDTHKWSNTPMGAHFPHTINRWCSRMEMDPLCPSTWDESTATPDYT